MSNLVVRGRRRTVLLALVFGLAILAVAACSDSEDPTATTAPSTGAATTVPVVPATTEVPPADTQVPAAETQVPPAATEVPPADTRVPPAATQPVSNATPVPDAVSSGESDVVDVVIDVVSVGDFGEILIGPNRLTLYIFDKDTSGVSNCSGGCLNAWPPLLTDGAPASGAGVTAVLDTIVRDDGSTQVTVNGFPVYYYASDSSEGDTGGHGVSNVWWVVAADGSPQRPAKIGVSSDGEKGEILVDGSGLAIYIFDRDDQGVSNCSGGCQGAWPPLLAQYGSVVLGNVTAELGTITRDDGTTQVTVNGFPAYNWSGDSSAGDAGGHGFSNLWWVFNPDGSPQRPAKVAAAESSAFGPILVDGSGRTLYIFDNDTAGVSNCSGGCLNAWPPLLTQYGAVALDRVTAELGTITRDDGTMQVTVKGFPAYYWAGDSSRGDTGGHGVNDVWWVFNSNGTPHRLAPIVVSEPESGDGYGY